MKTNVVYVGFLVGVADARQRECFRFNYNKMYYVGLKLLSFRMSRS